MRAAAVVDREGRRGHSETEKALEVEDHPLHICRKESQRRVRRDGIRIRPDIEEAGRLAERITAVADRERRLRTCSPGGILAEADEHVCRARTEYVQIARPARRPHTDLAAC